MQINKHPLSSVKSDDGIERSARACRERLRCQDLGERPLDIRSHKGIGPEGDVVRAIKEVGRANESNNSEC